MTSGWHAMALHICILMVDNFDLCTSDGSDAGDNPPEMGRALGAISMVTVQGIWGIVRE